MLERVAEPSFRVTMSFAPCWLSTAFSAPASFGGPSSEGIGSLYFDTATISARISACAGCAAAVSAVAAARATKSFRIPHPARWTSLE